MQTYSYIDVLFSVLVQTLLRIRGLITQINRKQIVSEWRSIASEGWLHII